MKQVSADDAFRYIESFTNLEQKTTLYEREYRLDRMKYLLSLFGDPHRSLNIIHIAGSKGKGSTAAYVSAILTELGFKTGLYTSPHIETYRERITLSGLYFSDSVYISNIELIKTVLEKTELPFSSGPTTFELLTLLAFLVFKSSGCSWAVIETGIGGRLDATNTVKPVCSVITLLELEHQDILGYALTDIAYEKSGIIKKECPVYSAVQKPDAAEVIIKKAAEENSPLYFLNDHTGIDRISVSLEGTAFTALLKNLEINLFIRMIGRFQAENAVLAGFAVYNTAIANNFYPGDSTFAAVLQKSLLSVKLPGRLEYFPGTDTCPGIILDSSHTPQSAQMLSNTLSELFTGKGVLIFGSVEGKDHKGMFVRLADNFSRVIISKPGTFKKSSPEKIFSDFKKLRPGLDIIYEENIEKAIDIASSVSGKENYIAVCGSFYLVSEARKIIHGGSRCR